LTGGAKQWYIDNVSFANGRWKELVDKFCLKYFPPIRIIALRKNVLGFKQNKKETLGAAWERFLRLVNSGPMLSIPEHVLLQHFYAGLDTKSTGHLDDASGGLFP